MQSRMRRDLLTATSPGRPRPPESLDPLRAILDEAAVKRVLIPLESPVSSAAELAVALAVPLANVADALLAEADGDKLMILITGGTRVDLPKVAALLGARRVRLAGAVPTRSRVHTFTPTLITSLPTVMDRALVSHSHIFGRTVDPLWILKISPEGLRKVLHPLVGDCTRASEDARTDGKGA